MGGSFLPARAPAPCSGRLREADDRAVWDVISLVGSSAVATCYVGGTISLPRSTGPVEIRAVQVLVGDRSRDRKRGCDEGPAGEIELPPEPLEAGSVDRTCS